MDIQSFGSNVFLPGTRRWKKYGGRGYDIVVDDLDTVISEGDPEGAERFADWVADQLASQICGSSKGRERAEFVFDPAPQWDGTLPDERQQKYLDSALAGEAKKVAEAKEGGRNDALNIAALKLGHYVAGAGLDQDKVITQLKLAAIECGLADDDGGEMSVHATIRSGLRAGIKTPRAVPQMTEEGDFFGDKGGLLAKQLAEAVMRGVRCGFNDITKKFYVYDGGVWVLNADHIEAEIGRLLGNSYRKSHTRVMSST